MTTALLSTTYFGPIQWYQKLYRYDHCLIEQYDSFLKQTYRNRCIIATTQGLQALTIPVEHCRPLSAENGQQTAPDALMTKDIRISDHGNWRHLHWNALQSAYGESPFFEFYADDIRPFFEQRWDYLIDFNEAITEKMCELLDIRPQMSLTTEWNKTLPEARDFRTAIHPKHPEPDAEFRPSRYYQVYEQKFGFQPNLSILDLLFNEGNESIYSLSPTLPERGGSANAFEVNFPNPAGTPLLGCFPTAGMPKGTKDD
jgi:hypothetical protein